MRVLAGSPIFSFTSDEAGFVPSRRGAHGRECAEGEKKTKGENAKQIIQWDSLADALTSPRQGQRSGAPCKGGAVAPELSPSVLLLGEDWRSLGAQLLKGEGGDILVT